MIDHLIRYADEAEALADPLVAAYRTPAATETRYVTVESYERPPEPGELVWDDGWQWAGDAPEEGWNVGWTISGNESPDAPPAAVTFSRQEEQTVEIPAGWDTSRVIPGVRVYTLGEPVETEDGPQETREYLPYWYLWIALPERREDLTCMVVADRESRTVIASLIPAEAWPLYHCDPVIAGSNYPFGL